MKDWNRSKGIIGGIISIFAAVAMFSTSAHDAISAVVMVFQDLAALAGAIGGLLAIYGRWKAGGVRLPVVGAAAQGK